MKCRLCCEKSGDVHIQLHQKTAQASEVDGGFFFWAESTLLKSLDLVATS